VPPAPGENPGVSKEKGARNSVSVSAGGGSGKWPQHLVQTIRAIGLAGRVAGLVTAFALNGRTFPMFATVPLKSTIQRGSREYRDAHKLYFQQMQLSNDDATAAQENVQVSTQDPALLSLKEAFVAGVAAVWWMPTRRITAGNIVFFWSMLIKFGQGRGAQTLADLDRDLLASWIAAPHRQGGDPSPGSMNSRRWAIRFMYLVLTQLGVQCSDPTVYVAIPPREHPVHGMLTDDDIEALRTYSTSGQHARHTTPVMVALALTGANTWEIPRVCYQDVDLERGTVRLPGGTNAEPRTVVLDEWGKRQLSQWIDRTGAAHLPEDSLYARDQKEELKAPRSASSLIWKTLKGAGVKRENVRPQSVRSWVGRKVYRETGRIEAVAKALGCARWIRRRT